MLAGYRILLGGTGEACLITTGRTGTAEKARLAPALRLNADDFPEGSGRRRRSRMVSMHRLDAVLGGWDQ